MKIDIVGLDKAVSQLKGFGKAAELAASRATLRAMREAGERFEDRMIEATPVDTGVARGSIEVRTFRDQAGDVVLELTGEDYIAFINEGSSRQLGFQQGYMDVLAQRAVMEFVEDDFPAALRKELQDALAEMRVQGRRR